MTTTKTKRTLGNTPKKRVIKKTAVKKNNRSYLSKIAGILEPIEKGNNSRVICKSIE